MDYITLSAELAAIQAKLEIYAGHERNEYLFKLLSEMHTLAGKALEQAKYQGQRPLRNVNKD